MGEAEYIIFNSLLLFQAAFHSSNFFYKLPVLERCPQLDSPCPSPGPELAAVCVVETCGPCSEVVSGHSRACVSPAQRLSGLRGADDRQGREIDNPVMVTNCFCFRPRLCPPVPVSSSRVLYTVSAAAFRRGAQQSGLQVQYKKRNVSPVDHDCSRACCAVPATEGCSRGNY